VAIVGDAGVAVADGLALVPEGALHGVRDDGADHGVEEDGGLVLVADGVARAAGGGGAGFVDGVGALGAWA